MEDGGVLKDGQAALGPRPFRHAQTSPLFWFFSGGTSCLGGNKHQLFDGFFGEVGRGLAPVSRHNLALNHLSLMLFGGDSSTSPTGDP